MSTETGWTKGLPAKSGWYFMRTEGEGVFAEGMVVWVGHNQSGVRHEGEFMYAAHPWLKRREFLGPILHSDFEQLLRLRKASVLFAIPYEALLMDADSKKWIAPKVWKAIENAVAALREALTHTGDPS